MAQRVTLRTRLSYNTRSNRRRVVKTPGGKLVVHYTGKRGKQPKCGDCEHRLSGIPAVRPIVLSRLPKFKRTVARTYGGTRCGNCVKERIMRSFLIEEARIVKEVIRGSKKKKKKQQQEQQEQQAQQTS
ncbi:ribosomal protein L34e-domain-containing protein [Cantharellus anzutake]|uniref:ribosomal protein L34e-domain-containing protein n=1 Tax=Cantharellus anzutake TaxID=1750568 RepID=UPI001904198D|nr:ribosomal protein L34e-domain-containing protein [Cantharellus anzutake]KAF8333134.1 ribosomal protein L34e-domain-containing protein [Cantharellus anzutake]